MRLSNRYSASLSGLLFVLCIFLGVQQSFAESAQFEDDDAAYGYTETEHLYANPEPSEVSDAQATSLVGDDGDSGELQLEEDGDEIAPAASEPNTLVSSSDTSQKIDELDGLNDAGKNEEERVAGIEPQGSVISADVADGQNSLLAYDSDVAQEAQSDSDVLVSGVSGGCVWRISESGCLTISPSEGGTGKIAGAEWKTYSDLITEVVVEEGVSISSFYNHFSLPKVTHMDLSSLDTSSATSMRSVFSGCKALQTLDIHSWNVGKCRSFSGMFSGCLSLTSLALFPMDAGIATDCSSMFLNCSSLSQLDCSTFDTSKVTTMSHMFAGCSSVEAIDVSGFDTGALSRADAMFSGCEKLASLNLGQWDMKLVTKADYFLNGCKSLQRLSGSLLNVNRVESLASFFHNCSSLEFLDLSGFETSDVETFAYMFAGCSSLKELDLSGFDTSSATNLEGMFKGCSSLSGLDLSSFATTNVTSMISMFEGCSALPSLNLTGFDTSGVLSMASMFSGCSSISSIRLGQWDSASLRSTENMFANCANISELDLSHWNTPGVNRCSKMFANCTSLSRITLGEGFYLPRKDNSYYNTGLKASSISPYTGRWVKVGEGGYVYGYNELWPMYMRPGTWVWQQSIASGELALGIYDEVYSGLEKRPDVRVLLGSNLLLAGDDYDVVYTNNVSAGSATVTVTGRGEFTGELTEHFAIRSKQVTPTISLMQKAVEYSGKPATPTVHVLVDGVELPSSDYSVTYKNNNAVGTGIVEVSLNGNYSGAINSTFDISPGHRKIIAENIKVKMGESAVVRARLSAGTGRLQFKTMDSSVATVSKKGVILPSRVGSTSVIITASSDDSYLECTQSIRITVQKGANPLVAKPKTVNVSSKSLKKGKVEINAIKVSKAIGKVTYSMKSKGTSKGFSVNKSGKIVVPKGVAKGKYKVKVVVKAAGNKNYKAKSKTVTVLVNVR